MLVKPTPPLDFYSKMCYNIIKGVKFFYIWGGKWKYDGNSKGL